VNELTTKLAQIGQGIAEPDKPENAVKSDGSLAPGAKLSRAINQAADAAGVSSDDENAPTLAQELGGATSAVTAGNPIGGKVSE
jgi:hypothetical protein